TVCSESARTDLDAQDHYAARSGGQIRAHRRSNLSWGSCARSILYHAAAARLGTIPHTDPEFVFMWQRHAPRGGLDRGLRGQRCARDFEGPEALDQQRRCLLPEFIQHEDHEDMRTAPRRLREE